ncbi:TetR/AcrR family transcriptional regulator [Paraburkholderia phytofirmans]|uniref:TetR family transcriptional regulator n=1 Tax=Paraburkholderia phytofirmans OLGA172 TaxID=1417228 RepID=A0A161I7M1_9BURK|nr:TetR/AcrR family transcriptional regulator [Paraburkholderia phytofirmans]ANB75253.1 TetR family transcriptional regulator [Paraburkholderia phytofirmans OLGA172]
MGVSRQQAVENRRAIVAAAEKLFRERGVDAVGLAELMKAAGFTQGGFYNHFKSKDALVAAVMEKAMKDGGEGFASITEDARSTDADPLRHNIQWYLSHEHRANIDTGCPWSGFVGDARRFDDVARGSYAEGLAVNLERFAKVIEESTGISEGSRRKAITLFSQMVGTLLLSRAVADVDPALADEILDEGREHLLTAVDTQPGIQSRGRSRRG